MVHQPSVGRRILRTGKRVGLAAGNTLASGLLRSTATRRLLNAAYERLGPRFQDPFDLFFSGATVPLAFEWKCRFGEHDLRMPVLPELQRSWNAALAWRWAGNRSIRWLYELYLENGPPGIFFDVGANDGTHTYPFALHGYRCVAFEPQLSCIDYIGRVCALNSLSNVTTVQCLVSDESGGEVEFFVSTSSWFSSRLRHHVERFEPAAAVRMATTSLDQYSKDQGLSPSLLKIDVEGWEWHVIHGGVSLIENSRPDVFVEVLATNPDKQAVWELFCRLDYRCYQVAHYSPTPFRRLGGLSDFMSTPGAYSNDYVFSRHSDLVTRLDEIIASHRRAAGRLARRARSDYAHLIARIRASGVAALHCVAHQAAAHPTHSPAFPVPGRKQECLHGWRARQ